jgi:uncharacterized protein (TIGR02996 family)
MSLEQSFLDDIIAHPNEDAVRLIYADWLTDQGDLDSLARAEFIRLQCALAQGRGTREQFQRERELLATHAKKWLGGSQPPLEECRFERGFLAQARIEAQSLLADAETFFRCHPLQQLTLFWGLVTPHERVHDLRKLVSLPAFRNLVELDLTGASLGSLGIMALIDHNILPRLTSLNLRNNHIGDAGMRALAASPLLTQLTILDLSGNLITGRGVRLLLDRVAELTAEDVPLRFRTLNLRGNRLGLSAQRALLFCPALRRCVLH